MKKLEKIRHKLGETSKRLSDLDKKHKALDAIVDRAKSYKVSGISYTLFLDITSSSCISFKIVGSYEKACIYVDERYLLMKLLYFKESRK